MDTNLIQKNTGFFSFSDSAADLAINRKFIEGYGELQDGVHNENTFIWEALSAIGNDIGNTIYENVLNYIQDVADINTCSIKSVCSISKMVGDETYDFMGNFSSIPIDVQRLLDIFSINKQYLFDKNVLAMFPKIAIEFSSRVGTYQQNFEKLSSEACSFLSSSVSSEVSVSNYIPEDFYESFVSSVFYDVLTSNLYATYDGKTDYIFNNLSAGLIQLSSFTSDFLEDHYRDVIEEYQESLDIPSSFKAFLETDKYENGEKEWSDFTEGEKAVISRIRSYREMPKYDMGTGKYSSLESVSKYAYYREKTFFDYVSFIESQYIFKGKSETLSSYYDLVGNSKPYYLDGNLTELTFPENSQNVKNLRLFSVVENEETQTSYLYLDFEKVKSMALVLKDICFAIVDIREKLKTKAQKNHMRGTFVLISYLINQYLCKNLPLQYPELSGLSKTFTNTQDTLDKSGNQSVKIQEYEDNTEYFNLSSEFTDKAINSEMAVMPFWKAEVEEESVNFKDINEFYLATMNLKTAISAVNDVQNPRDFLDILFECGATKTYIPEENVSVVIPGIVAEGYGLEVEKNPSLSDNYYEVAALQRETFLKFNGTEIGYAPYYNYKNVTQSSYQVHPFLWKFAEYEGLKSSVRNAYYNSANEDILRVLMSPSLSMHLGDFGNVLNIWKDDVFDFSGYRSRYENGSHSIKNGVLEHYDGLWYPDAIEEYISAQTETNLFLALTYSVENRMDSNEICEILKNPLSANSEYYGEKLSDIFYSYKVFNDELSTLISKYENETSPEILSSISSDIDFLVSNRQKTFFEKWYNKPISKTDAKYIANQLRMFQSNINETYFGQKNIYKYGIDKYGNGIILLKNFNESDSFLKKKNTPGDLWIKQNSAPIGFPAFQIGDNGNEYSSVRNDGMNGSLLDYLNKNLIIPSKIRVISVKENLIYFSINHEDGGSNIYKSIDGGNTYKFIYSTGHGWNSGKEIQGIQIGDDNTVVFFTSHNMFISRDGGLSISEIRLPITFLPRLRLISVFENYVIAYYTSTSIELYRTYVYDYTVENSQWQLYTQYVENEIGEYVPIESIYNGYPIISYLFKNYHKNELYGCIYDHVVSSFKPFKLIEIDGDGHKIYWKRDDTFPVGTLIITFDEHAEGIPFCIAVKDGQGKYYIKKYSSSDENWITVYNGYKNNLYAIYDENLGQTFLYTNNAGLNVFSNGSFISSSKLGTSKSLFYDFDITKDYKYLVLAAKSDVDGPNSYLSSTSFLLEPYEDSTNYDYKNLEYNYSYTFRSFSDDKTYDLISDNFDFQGFFPDGDNIFALYSQFDGTNQMVLHEYNYPEGEGFTSSTVSINLSDDLRLGTKLAENPNFIFGYDDGAEFQTITMAFLTQMEEDNVSAYTFIGKNESLTSDTNISEILDRKYGRCNYLSDSIDVVGETSEEGEVILENTSIDRLSTYLTLASFPKSGPNTQKQITISKNYNLNSDASFIPLYSGTMGEIKTWGVELYRDFNKEKSLQLMGYSFNKLSSAIDVFSEAIFKDEDGYLTNSNPEEVLSCMTRIYENMETKEVVHRYVYQKYMGENGKTSNTSNELSYYYLSCFNNYNVYDSMICTGEDIQVYRTSNPNDPKFDLSNPDNLDATKGALALYDTAPHLISSFILSAEPPSTQAILKDVRINGFVDDVITIDGHKIQGNGLLWTHGFGKNNIFKNQSIKNEIVNLQSYQFNLGLYDWPAEEIVDGKSYPHCGLNQVSLGDKWGDLSTELGNDLSSLSDYIWLGTQHGDANTWRKYNDGITPLETDRPCTPLCVIWEWEVPGEHWREKNNEIPGMFGAYFNPKFGRNDGDKKTDDQGNAYYFWEQELLPTINRFNASDYTLWMYNLDRGMENPIYKGDLTAVTEGNFYLSAIVAEKTSEYKKVDGTPDVFKYDKNVLLNDTGLNYIQNISDIQIGLEVNEFGNIVLKTKFFLENPDSQNLPLLDKNTVVALVFNKNLEEFGDYHYLYHHDIWPYLSGWNNYDINGQSLENIYSFGENMALGTGTLAFKINEESPDIKYPTRAVYDFLADLFESTNVTFGRLSNVFDLSNTYIFELDTPKSIADIIGTIKMNVYPVNEEYAMVYEDYLSSKNFLGRDDSDVLCCISFWDTSALTYGNVKDENSNEYMLSSAYVNAMSSFTLMECLESLVDGQIYNDGMIEEILTVKGNKLSIESEGGDVPAQNYETEEVDFEVTEEQIKDFMKIYVNYLVDSNEGIHLYFNYNNLFCSPYSYRRRDGRFYTQFKPETYLHLAPGESGFLTIVVQLKYFDGLQNLRGVKDQPVLIYKIWNISDDKPKFVIKNTWMLTKEMLIYNQNPASEEKMINLDIGSSYIPVKNPENYLYDSYVLKKDLTCSVDVQFSPEKNSLDFRTLTCDFLYEYNDPDIEFLPTKSSGGRFSERNGKIRMSTSYFESLRQDEGNFVTLTFKLRKGAVIDEDNPIKFIPVDAMNLKAYDKNGNKMIPNRITSGGITIVFNAGGAFDKLLAKEDNRYQENGTFNGYVLAENKRVIKIYENKAMTVRRIG